MDVHFLPVRSRPVSPILAARRPVSRPAQQLVRLPQRQLDAAGFGLVVDHGPDAQAFDTFKSNLISMTTLGAAYTPPCVLVGGTKPSTEGSPNAVIRSVIKTEGNGADSSATVELWLFLKTV
jgi:hypothetical protein